MIALVAWFVRLISLRPHRYIGGEDDPYMLRWHLIPRNKWLGNLYLHKFVRDDDDRALHDHPWPFVSIVLWGSYNEWVQVGDHLQILQTRSMFNIAWNHAEHRHRVVLPRRANGSVRPCWTLVFTGRKSRLWGFWCAKGFVPWYDFSDSEDSQKVGKGCGE